MFEREFHYSFVIRQKTAINIRSTVNTRNTRGAWCGAKVLNWEKMRVILIYSIVYNMNSI